MITVKILKYYIIIIIFIQRFSIFVDCNETVIILITDIFCYSIYNFIFSNSTWQGPFVYIIKTQLIFSQFSFFYQLIGRQFFYN